MDALYRYLDFVELPNGTKVKAYWGIKGTSATVYFNTPDGSKINAFTLTEENPFTKATIMGDVFTFSFGIYNDEPSVGIEG